jgi:hypothetical protein
MALEQITGEVVTDDQEQPSPKGKLASMKKKVKTMDTELRKNVPVSQVKKEDQDFVDAMEDARKKTAAEIAKKPKTFDDIRTKVTNLPDKEMKVVSPAARRSALMNSMRDARAKKSILQSVYDKVTGQDEE